MKRKVFMALAIGAGCCLITGNVLMAQPSVPQWEYVEQTDDGMLVFRMGEIELKVPEDWEDSYVRKEKDGGEAFYLKDSAEKEKNKLFWLKDSSVFFRLCGMRNTELNGISRRTALLQTARKQKTVVRKLRATPRSRRIRIQMIILILQGNRKTRIKTTSNL